MNYAILLPVDFLDHPKTRKLHSTLGPEAVLCLLRLWLWAATNSIDGWLPSDADTAELETLARWCGEPGKFIKTLHRLRFLDKFSGDFRLHQWTEHQRYCVAAKERIEKAKRAGNVSVARRREKFGTAQPRKSPELVVRAIEDTPRTSSSELSTQQQQTEELPAAVPTAKPIATGTGIRAARVFVNRPGGKS